MLRVAGVQCLRVLRQGVFRPERQSRAVYGVHIPAPALFRAQPDTAVSALLKAQRILVKARSGNVYTAEALALLRIYRGYVAYRVADVQKPVRAEIYIVHAVGDIVDGKLRTVHAELHKAAVGAVLTVLVVALPLAVPYSVRRRGVGIDPHVTDRRAVPAHEAAAAAVHGVSVAALHAAVEHFPVRDLKLAAAAAACPLAALVNAHRLRLGGRLGCRCLRTPAACQQ